MRKKINEKHKLPLTFKYIETFNNKIRKNDRKNIIYFIKCEKYDTDFYVRERPQKPLVRLL